MRSTAEPFRVDFQCPHCNAGYTVVRMRNESGATYRPVHCRVCSGPLRATEGDEILRYLLVVRPRLAPPKRHDPVSPTDT
jgi:hypothetical protein